MGERRNKLIDILKGVAIILMVIGHSGCPGVIHDYIYLFHMPLFFFISGYLFKISYLDRPLTFVGRRIKSCYVPFVKYSFFFLLIHELLVPLGLTRPYDYHDYLRQSFMIVSLSGTEKFLGPYWFLTEMLVSSCLFIGELWCLKYIFKPIYSRKDTNKKQLGGVIVFSFTIIVLFDIFDIHIPKVSIRSFLAVIYLAMGYLWKLSERKIKVLGSLSLLALLLFVLLLSPFKLGNVNDGGMDVNSTIQVLLYLPASLVGVIGVWSLFSNIMNKSSDTSNRLFKVLTNLGQNSMGILTWHILGLVLTISILGCLECSGLPAIHVKLCENSWWMLLTLNAIILSNIFMLIEKSMCTFFRKK